MDPIVHRCACTVGSKLAVKPVPPSLPRRQCDADEADWNIVKRGWEAHVLGEASHTFKDAATAIKTLRVGRRLLGGGNEFSGRMGAVWVVLCD